jgi:hypothetical protein
MANTWNTVNQPYVNSATYTATSGSVLTAAGLNGTSWANPSVSFTSSNQKSLLTIPHGEDKIVLSDEATLEVKGTVKINGIDLEERLKTIERVLAIPERDATMEAKYPSLKKKFDDYINTLEKYRTFERIKGEDQ